MSTHAARRSSGTAFTVVVTVLTALGALAMAGVLALTGAPTSLAVGVALAALPVGPLVACFLWLDRYEPEPRSLLIMALAWGAFVATASALVLQTVGVVLTSGDPVFAGVIAAPVTEEAMKGLFILLLLWFRRHELDGILDGLVYAGMVGIGFAFTENILYLSSAYLGEDGQPGGISGAVALFVVRGVFSPFAHPLFTAFIGVGVGVAVSSPRTAVRVIAPLLGFAGAVGAHAAWNGSVFIGGGEGFIATYLLLMVPAFLLMVGFAIWARSREAQVLTRALADCAGRGFLHAAEIPWLVSLSARRAARRHAATAGGEEGLRTMRDYQQHAVELGFLHHRFLRGTAPVDFAARGQHHVDALAALRPALLWPGAPGTTGTQTSGHAAGTTGGAR